ncbi:hypothetical protein ACIBTV_21300 [Micromonospora sp. NPDC049366]|uniref:hypothetical protein n=1 Tax=Micromonospora sp. NPDC049366 TaxID=3364271 RepID=UPI0037A9414B
MTDDEREMREYTRNLFAEHEDDNWAARPAEPAKPPADPKTGNVVPREGATVGPGPLTGDAETREWAAELFHRANLQLP